MGYPQQPQVTVTSSLVTANTVVDEEELGNEDEIVKQEDLEGSPECSIADTEDSVTPIPLQCCSGDDDSSSLANKSRDVSPDPSLTPLNRQESQDDDISISSNADSSTTNSAIETKNKKVKNLT